MHSWQACWSDVCVSCLSVLMIRRLSSRALHLYPTPHSSSTSLLVYISSINPLLGGLLWSLCVLWAMVIICPLCSRCFMCLVDSPPSSLILCLIHSLSRWRSLPLPLPVLCPNPLSPPFTFLYYCITFPSPLHSPLHSISVLSLVVSVSHSYFDCCTDADAQNGPTEHLRNLHFMSYWDQNISFNQSAFISGFSNTSSL